MLLYLQWRNCERWNFHLCVLVYWIMAFWQHGASSYDVETSKRLASMSAWLIFTCVKLPCRDYHCPSGILWHLYPVLSSAATSLFIRNICLYILLAWGSLRSKILNTLALWSSRKRDLWGKLHVLLLISNETGKKKSMLREWLRTAAIE